MSVEFSDDFQKIFRRFLMSVELSDDLLSALKYLSQSGLFESCQNSNHTPFY